MDNVRGRGRGRGLYIVNDECMEDLRRPHIPVQSNSMDDVKYIMDKLEILKAWENKPHPYLNGEFV